MHTAADWGWTQCALTVYCIARRGAERPRRVLEGLSSSLAGHPSALAGIRIRARQSMSLKSSTCICNGRTKTLFD